MLFDDNLGFVTYNFNDQNKTPNPKLTSLKEGFERGNMFENLYKPYKNYTYFKVEPTTKQEELLLEIMNLSFAINDLELFLDLHPNDTELLNKFKNLITESYQKEMEYIKMYGPLELTDDDNKNKFTWIKNPWPWDNNGGTKYV